MSIGSTAAVRTKGAVVGLHVHHGPHLLALTESLATLLATPLADPFTAEVIAVPTAGIRDWLQQQLAFRLGATGRHDGVSANITLVFPAAFAAAALGQAPLASDPWDIGHLTWAVLQVLESTSLYVPGYPTRASAAVDPLRTRYATARRIADLFDRYATNRPQMLHQWSLGHDGDGTLDERRAVVPLTPDQEWQPALWRQVRAVVDVPSQAEIMPDLLSSLLQAKLQSSLPSRVGVFGVSAIAPAQLSVLRALAAHRDVHLYLIHPSGAAWQKCRQQLAGNLTLRNTCDATANVSHRLLRSWARPSMETAALLAGVVSEQHHHLNAPTDAFAHSPLGGASRSLLHQLQADIIADLEPTGTHTIVDNSLQVHACHGPTRQLEVLRDALGHLFAADPTLAPRDVIVVCPDLARFAPLIGSVFQRGNFPVPVHVSDLSLGADNPVATALSSVLAVTAARCTASDLLGLCSLAPIRRMLGLSNDDISLIDQWLVDLDTTWGLDSEHRSQWVPAHINQGTWAATLDRLLLGAAMPAPAPRVGPSGIVPFDDVDADSLRTAGILAEFIARLQGAREATSGEHTIQAWAGVLSDIVNSLCATDPIDAWQLAQVLATIDDLREQSVIAGSPCQVALSLSDIRSMLGGLLHDQGGRLNLRSGSVTVTTMVPVRNVAARVICVLGLDEAKLRSAGTDGDDLLGSHPCVGERDQRIEGRHLLLDALMAAGDHFIITCDGSDITTNRRLPLPVQLIELLDTVALTLSPHATHDTASPSVSPGTSVSVEPPTESPVESPVVIRHPRQAHDERNFLAAATASWSTQGQPFGFDGVMLSGAYTRRQPKQSANSHSPGEPLPRFIPDTVTLAQLAQSCSRPAYTYLADRLDVRLPTATEEVESEIPINISPLETWRLGTNLLDQHRDAAPDHQFEQWRAAQQLQGALPPRALAKVALDDIEREVALLLDSDPDLRSLITSSDTASIDLGLTTPEPLQTDVRLVDTVVNIAHDTLVRVSFTRPGPRFEIAASIELAAVVLAYPSREWQAIVVNRGSGSKPTAVRLRPVAGPTRSAAARHLLTTALHLRLRALTEPIPLFEWSSRSLFESGSIDESDFERDLRNPHTNFVWGQTALDDLIAPPLGERAVSLAHSVWEAYHAFVDPAPHSGEVDE